MFASYRLATADVANTDRTEGCSIAMWSILVLTNLCAAGIAGIDPGFGGSVHSLDYCTFPGLLLVQVIALGVGLIVVLHLDLLSSLLPSDRLTSLTTPGSIFMLTNYKFNLITFSLMLNVYPVQWEDTELTELSR